MAKHLTDDDIHNIVSTIDAWSHNDKFTWGRLCERLESHCEIITNRQTLQRFSRVKDAFDLCKVRTKFGAPKKKKGASSLAYAQKRIETLEAENGRLRRENDNLLHQFVTWQYNLDGLNISIKRLNRSLPSRDDRNESD
ncbi:MAG: hypothetical protein HRU20_07790 [Pseudomonadales bacterium]|nr:hypothetical protein [Pseudomonadales bacterium]